MKTLWTVIEALLNLNQHALPADFKSIFEINIVQKEFSNEYYSFYGSAVPIEFDGLKALELIISVKNASRTVKAVSINYLSGTCIDLKSVNEHYGRLNPLSPPRSPAPIATTVWGTTIKGKTIRFGFANQSPDCLSEVSISYEP